MNFLSDKYDKFISIVAKLEDENNTLKINNENLNKRLQSIEFEFYNQQQQQLSNFITIHGIPKQQKEDTKDLVVKTIKILDSNLDSVNVISCRRMLNKSAQDIAPIIVAEVDDIQTKTRIKSNYKTNGPIILSQIMNTPHCKQQKIFINDYLSNYHKNILNLAKKLKQTYGFKFVWTKNGNVYLRYTEQSPVIQIKTEDDIADVDSKFKKNISN